MALIQEGFSHSGSDPVSQYTATLFPRTEGPMTGRRQRFAFLEGVPTGIDVGRESTEGMSGGPGRETVRFGRILRERGKGRLVSKRPLTPKNRCQTLGTHSPRGSKGRSPLAGCEGQSPSRRGPGDKVPWPSWVQGKRGTLFPSEKGV